MEIQSFLDKLIKIFVDINLNLSNQLTFFMTLILLT